MFRPVGPVHFVGIVKETAGPSGIGLFKSPVKLLQVMIESLFRQVIHDQAFSSGSRTLDLLQGLAAIKGNEFAFFPGGQFQYIIFYSLYGQNFSTTVGRHKQQCLQLSMRPLPVVLHLEINALCGSRFGTGRRRNGYTFELVTLYQLTTGRISRIYFGPSEGPAGTSVHIHYHLQAGGLVLHMLEHLHPAGRQIGNIAGFFALYTINGGDFHTAYTCLMQIVQIPVQILLVHGAAQPPPTGSGLIFGTNCGPFCGRSGRRNGGGRDSRTGRSSRCDRCGPRRGSSRCSRCNRCGSHRGSSRRSCLQGTCFNRNLAVQQQYGH